MIHGSPRSPHTHTQKPPGIAMLYTSLMEQQLCKRIAIPVLTTQHHQVTETNNTTRGPLRRCGMCGCVLAVAWSSGPLWRCSMCGCALVGYSSMAGRILSSFRRCEAYLASRESTSSPSCCLASSIARSHCHTHTNTHACTCKCMRIPTHMHAPVNSTTWCIPD